MKKFIKNNIWWLSFVTVFLFGILIVLIYCKAKSNYTIKDIDLNIWLSYFSACGTIGGFLYLILDKILGQKESNHLLWQSQIPFVTLTSPCDPSSNYCQINILEYQTEFAERGNGYFSVCNLGKTNAYDIKIEFYTKDIFIESNIFNRHYIPYLPPLEIKENYYFNYREFIYSHYNVNPDTKEISNNKFEICGCLTNCQLSTVNTDEKYFYVKIEYFSSFSKKHRYKITSTIKVNVICKNETLINEIRNIVFIKGINIISYDYEEE